MIDLKEIKHQELPYLPPFSNRSTSLKAAKIILDKVVKRKQRVLHFIKYCQAGGATSSELHLYLGLFINSVGPVTDKLWRQDKIRKSGCSRESEETGFDNEIWLAREYVEGDKGKHPGHKSIKLELDILLELENRKITESETDNSVIRRLLNLPSKV